MTPAARLQMAIEILQGLEQTTQPFDRFLKAWFRTRRFAGSKDRRAIAERVFSVIRHRARLGHRMADTAPRALVIAALLDEGEDLDALFNGGYGPAPLTEEERAAIAASPPPEPAWVSGEYPAWLEAELTRAFGDNPGRGNVRLHWPAHPPTSASTRYKTSRDASWPWHNAEGVTATLTPYTSDGLRIGGDATQLSRSALFESGAFEFPGRGRPPHRRPAGGRKVGHVRVLDTWRRAPGVLKPGACSGNAEPG